MRVVAASALGTREVLFTTERVTDSTTITKLRKYIESPAVFEEDKDIKHCR